MPTGASALMLLPMTLAVPFAAFLCGRQVARHGRVRPLLRAGTALAPLGLAALALLPAGALVPAALAMVVLGLGLGLQMPSALLLAQQSVPRHMIGLATALTVFFRLLGGAIGIAVLTAVALALIGPHAAMGSAEGGPAAWAAHAGARVDDAAFRVTLLAGAGLALLGLACSLRLRDVRLHGPDDAALAAAMVD
jgi:hypothetical protein